MPSSWLKVTTPACVPLLFASCQAFPPQAADGLGFKCINGLVAVVLHAADCNIVRSRDPAVLDECDVVIDVGGVYEADRDRFDHHQRGFSEVFGHGYNTKLSSAGKQLLDGIGVARGGGATSSAAACRYCSVCTSLML
jgi:hypothetical protein